MVKKTRSSRNDGWYDQLQAAILELITCRDVGDSVDDGEVGHERRPLSSWWECAEGDCGLELEERRRSRHVIKHRPVSTLEWSRSDAFEAPLPPTPVPKPRVCKENEPPLFPRPTLTGSSQDEKPEASPVPPFGRDSGETSVKIPGALGDIKRMGPVMLCPAVPQKLGDHPAPSFQVGMSFLEPFSGLSTASSLPRKQQKPGGMVLQVLLQNDRWVPLHFHRNDDLMRCTCDFLQEHKLSTLVKDGLLNQLKQMVTMRQLSASVDVVDLL